VSTFAAISGVSSTLRNLLKDRMEQAASITIAPPDVNVSSVSGKRINLYLYQVTENAALRNQDFVAGGGATAYGRPPLCLDLHYLVTAFGGTETAPDADLQAQLVLGDAMRAFHEYAVVTPALRQGDLPANPPVLDPSLAGAVENLRITLLPTGLEEVTKIWAALPQANFRRSVVYLVTVVQIESRKPRRPALPVRRARAAVQTFHFPTLESVARSPALPGYPPALAEVGDTVVLGGQDLMAQVTKVKVGDALVDPVTLSETELSFVLPAPLAAGVAPVSVVHGPPASPTRVESNALPLLIAPKVIGVAPPTAGPGATVTVTVSPPVRATQDRKIILNDRMLAVSPVAANSPPSATVAFTMPSGPAAVPAGKQLLRVRVDGADSRLAVDPNTGEYAGPNITAT
jgi:Pvc16 N-terminal domain